MDNQEKEESKELLSIMRFLSLSKFKGFSLTVISNKFELDDRGETIRTEHGQFFSNTDKLDLKETCILIQNTRLALSEIMDAAADKFGEDELGEQMKKISGSMNIYTSNNFNEG